MRILDLVIRNGLLVTAAGAAGRADIGIANGQIAQIGGELVGCEELDATGKLILPGGIDAHVHLSLHPRQRKQEFSWVDDFTSGSAAALAGGITTLGNMTFLDAGETPLAGLEREASVAQAQTIADLFFHPVLDDPSTLVLDEIPQLLDRGCNSIKFFMSMPSFDAQASGFLQAMKLARAHGLLTLIHCEDFAIIDQAVKSLAAAGKTTINHYPASRPVIAEVVATQRAVAFAEATGAPVYIVHLSSRRALEVCAEAQARQVSVYVETRPLYLHLTRERFELEDGGKYVGAPPLRDRQDVDALWAGINQGTIHTVCTDHAPWSLAAKMDPAHSILNVRAGVANLQTMLPMLYSEGVRSGKISLGRLVQVTSTNVAKLFGLYPRKGEIAVGSDADLVLFDPDFTQTVDAAQLKSNAGYSPYEGWRVTGWPEITLRRGAIVYRRNEVLGQAGSGQLVSRGKTILL